MTGWPRHDGPVGPDAAGGGVAALTVLTLVAGGTVLPSAGAPGCGRDVAASDTADLRDAFLDAHHDAADAGCTTWELRISGTYLIEPGESPDAGPLFHETPDGGTSLPLRVVGPVGGTARIQADGDGTRLIDALDGGPITLERVVLVGGSVEMLIGDDLGGAVLADVVHLVESELIGNSAVGGGAVAARDVRAVRTSFVENGAVTDAAEDGAQGGAIRATGSVTLVNVTFVDNVAGEGGAVWLPASGQLDATFVTFVDNSVTTVGAGADLHLGLTGSGTVTLRGVLFAGVDDESDGPSCGGVALSATGMALEVDSAFEAVDDPADLSCDGVTPTIGPLALTTVPFLAGTTALPVPDGGPASIGQVACGAGWPAVDQRGVARPQGDTCDAGAVEREVVVVPPPPPPVPPAPDPQPEPAPEAVVAGPVPTSVPAGDGTCADGCPAFGSR